MTRPSSPSKPTRAILADLESEPSLEGSTSTSELWGSSLGLKESSSAMIPASQPPTEACLKRLLFDRSLLQERLHFTWQAFSFYATCSAMTESTKVWLYMQVYKAT